MALDKNDLKQITEIVSTVVDSRVTKSETYLKNYVDSSNAKLETGLKDYVDSSNAKLELDLRDFVEFAIEKSEQKMEVRFDKIDSDIGDIKGDIKEINRNIESLIETDNAFLDYLSGHEKRIVRVEKKLGIKPAI